MGEKEENTSRHKREKRLQVEQYHIVAAGDAPSRQGPGVIWQKGQNATHDGHGFNPALQVAGTDDGTNGRDRTNGET